ncbi:hypothetical protein [Flavonifractor sp. An100]|uniref:hypothetical protein n=1 Tax=Flavonifractor sp. An100 TaxID=1965538 RepID=UPI000B37177B|nr:hypothetical protein [Flavonifractor sp. An100]OUQ75915.1 hypothetical protein B5E43_13015 [Flavonifractor sp. An100]
MSFIITVHTNEGIIMASDSRTTYTNTSREKDGTVIQRIGVQITDTTYKTFVCNSKIGLSTCGTASINAMPIAGFIEDFIAQKITEESSVEEVAQELLAFFAQYTPLPGTNFVVAGYNKDDLKQHISRVYIATKQIVPIAINAPGVVWDGETDTLMRLVQNVALKKQENTYSDLVFYPIGYNYFTLQDAINFAEYAVDVTIKTMAFKDCVKTVGGPIDILAIKPSGAFWIQRKELHA